MRLNQLEDDADHCRECGTRLPQDRYWGRRQYCGKRCRHRAWWRLNADWLNELRREKKQAARVYAATHCEWCGNELPADRRVTRRYCNKRCAKRCWRARATA